MRIVYSPDCLRHYSPYEPAERVEAITSFLEEEAKGKYEFVKPAEIEEKDLLLVHSQRMIEDLKSRSETGMGLSENPFSKETFSLASIACGCALKASQIAEKEGFAFAITRPPGHHAGKDFYHGFCYMNNIALAVRKNWGKKRALIVDFDVHAGNGTIDIFEGDDSAFYLSLHQTVRTLFPFDARWEGRRSNINSVGLAPGTWGEEYLRIFRAALKEAVSSFKPERIAVSAGFDSYSLDGIAGLENRTETFRAVGAEIRKLGLPTFAVLEGGYYLPDLGRNVWSFVSAFV